MKTDCPSARFARSRVGSRASCLLSIAGVLALGGCASTTEVKIDSLSKPKPDAAVSYQIHSANPAVDENSLRYKEAASLVRTALSGKGLYEAPAGTKADLVVDLDYGLGPPQMKRETVSEPVYIALPGAVHYETVQVGTDRNGRPVYQAVAVQDPPRNEIAGFHDYEVTSVVYEKRLHLSARENKPGEEGRPPSEIWTIDATSEGQSHDLRKNLPILVAATIDYIGTDTHGQKTITVKDASSDVAFVKKGL